MERVITRLYERERQTRMGFCSETLNKYAARIEKLVDEGKDCEAADGRRIQRLERMLHEVAPCPQCGLDEAYSVRAATEAGTMWVCPGCKHSSGLALWPRRVVRVDKAGARL